jgi:hypothetical protein
MCKPFDSARCVLHVNLQILLRKGGIREPTFRPAASDFLLFPTSFHTDAQVGLASADAWLVVSSRHSNTLTTVLGIFCATMHKNVGVVLSILILGL